MRTLKTPAATASLLLAVFAPAFAQIKTDLGAAAASAAPGVSAAAVGANQLPSVGVLGANSALSGGLSAAPAALLAPAAMPSAMALPASAPAPSAAPALAPSAAAADAPTGPKSPSDAAPSSATPPPSSPRAAAAAPPGGPPVYFASALAKLGVPGELTARLVAFLETRHPGDQNAIYHGIGHSHEVANLAARIVESQDLPTERKILLIVSGALHDVDPERVPNTPARVSATLALLDSDPAARALLRDFSGRYGFTDDQVKALIMATDFSMVPAEMEAKQSAFVKAAKEAFPSEDWGVEWGRHLAFADQTSSYVGSVDAARKRVEGLANEIRNGMGGKGPTDAQILAGTYKFLSVLRGNPQFALLPAAQRADFEKVFAYFEKRQTPEAWTAAAAPVPARAPPDVDAAKRYIRSIAAGIALNERQTDGLLEQYFEEQGIAPGSTRADAVRRALLPAKVASEDKAAATLSPSLQRHRAVLLKIAAERKTTPAAVEATLARLGVLTTIAGLDDATFERQADRSLDRAELEAAVSGYPRNAQGDFMRALAQNMATPSGKSIEEVTRSGVFAYVDFNGSSVSRATTGRDPDVGSVQMVFYVTRAAGTWKIGGYRQNRRTGRSDAELARTLRNWLLSGGIPAQDLE
jgi:hypothetical protein